LLSDSVDVVVDIRWWLIPLGVGREISGVGNGSFDGHIAQCLIWRECTDRMSDWRSLRPLPYVWPS
jgi:hypothetical protein